MVPKSLSSDMGGNSWRHHRLLLISFIVTFIVAGTVLQVALILNTDSKDGIMEPPVNFKSFGATLSGPEALSALNLAIKLPILSYDKFMLKT